MSTGTKEFTVDQNTAHVEQAVATMSPAQIDEIERRAKARVLDVREETARVDEESKQANASEGHVYGGLMVEAVAPGAKILTTVAEFLDERVSEKPGRSFHEGKSKPRSIDDFVDDAKRPSGIYRAPAEARAYDGAAANSPRVPLRVVEDKTDIADRAGIAAKSLNDQGKDALSTWDVPEKKLASVKLAKELTFDTRIANEKALDSVHLAREQHAAMKFKMGQMAPGMGLGSGPSIRPEDLLREASTSVEGAA